MADITVTAANLVQGTGARITTGQSGEAIAQGQSVVINPADSLLYMSQALSVASPFRMGVSGIALGAVAAAGQPVTYQFDSVITFGSGVLVQGEIYIPSMNLGGIMPVGDMSIKAVITTQITSNVATITTALPHPFQTGQVVTLAGCGSIYNGTWTILAATAGSTTFTITITHANDGPNSVTGTAQVKGQAVNILGIAQNTSILQMLLVNSGIVR